MVAITDDLAAAADLDRFVKPATDLVKRLVPAGPLKDLLSGTWLGHPLHPLLTDVPIGAFTGATVLDVLGGRRSQPAARRLIALGLLAAVPTVAAGASDWSDASTADRRVGLVHAACNTLGLGCYALSWRARGKGHRIRGTALGLVGMTAMSVGGYLGGSLVYERGVGVNHAMSLDAPEEWTAVLQEDELAAGKPIRACDILLFRANGTVHAIGAVCTHAGGPLAEGTVNETACTIQCPWHQSVFRLTDGSVVHGPATAPEPAFETRVEAGSVEVRRRRTP